MIQLRRKFDNQFIVFFAALIPITVVYLYGLSGTFYLDDYATLPSLEQWGDLDSWAKLKNFISGGFTGPTGRPVSLLSFAIQSSCWPDQPSCFLIFNLTLHLLNAFLVFLFLKMLFDRLPLARDLKYWVPIAASLIWAAHPLQVSSVLYVIQRMVLLATFFNLLCLITYIRARQYAFNSQFSNAVVWSAFSAVCAVLAVFSKENAVLIPMQLLLLEFLFRWVGAEHRITRGSNVYIKLALLFGVIIPSLMIGFYLLEKLGKHTWHFLQTGEEYFTRRPFSFFERLFTQFRVLGDYILAILVPRGHGSGVFFDDYSVSKGLFSPISTLIWLIVHVGLLVFAFIYRKRLPLFSFGVLWFYSNHLIESTVITLELKFEHRNYMPLLGIAVAAMGLFYKAGLPVIKKNLIAGGGLLLLTGLLLMRTSLWGNPILAVTTWAQNSPKSLRSLETAALVYSQKGRPDEEIANIYLRAVEISDQDPVMVLKSRIYTCSTDPEIGLDASGLAPKLEKISVNWQIPNILEAILDKKIMGACPQFAVSEYQLLAEAIKMNHRFQKTSIPRKMDDLIARSELVFGDKEKAVALYKAVNYKHLKLEFIMSQALWMASYGQLGAAIEHLENGIKLSTKKTSFIVEQAEDMRARMLLDTSDK